MSPNDQPKPASLNYKHGILAPSGGLEFLCLAPPVQDQAHERTGNGRGEDSGGTLREGRVLRSGLSRQHQARAYASKSILNLSSDVSLRRERHCDWLRGRGSVLLV